MEIGNQIQLKFHGVDFPVINLNSEQPYPEHGNDDVVLSITPKVFYPRTHENYFKIIQEITVSSEEHFKLFVLAVGTFEFSSELDENLKKSFVNTNAPAIMFPYVRAFIAMLTSNLGNVTGALNIPPQFFKGDLEELVDL